MPIPLPRFIARRIWWWLPLTIWLATVAWSLNLQLDEQRRHGVEVATEGARNMFQMVVLMRSWNAEHGGVYVPISAKIQPNPYLQHPRRDLTTTDGSRLTMVNPAFMTRQLAELAIANKGALFHITSLKPIRPENAADAWETRALQAFEHGVREQVGIVDSGAVRHLRYMAPLTVKPACMACHAAQGYQVGQVRGGISVSLPYAPIEATIVPARRQAYASHILVFVLVSALGWLLLETLRRRWLDLDSNLVALESARNDLLASNNSLGQALRAAETASRAKSAFLATMSHEIRTPMNGILGMAGLLSETELSDEQRGYLGTLTKSGNNLLGLFNDVLDFSRMESGQSQSVEEKLFSPAGLLQSVADRLRETATNKGLRLVVPQVEAQTGLLLGDERHIQRILLHLLGNAIKFTDQGQVELSFEAIEGADRVQVCFTVQDTGTGVPDELRERLFQPFEIADATNTRRHGGIGLGLAICQRLAKAMGGEITFSSTPGAGSSFSLRLSLARYRPQAREIGAASLDRLETLLANDDIEATQVFLELIPQLKPLLADRFPILAHHIAA
jgi:signal transduction histidine kinase